MRKFAILTAVALAGLSSNVFAVTDKATTGGLPEPAKSGEFPTASVEFTHTGYGSPGKVKPGEPDIQVHDVYGGFTSGQHGTLMKWPVGFKSIVHSHTGGYYAIVVSGVLANYRPGDVKKSLLPGSYWFQKGGEMHVTECLSKKPCEAFLVQDVGFDAQFEKDH